MIRNERWLCSGVLATVAAAGMVLLSGCGEPAPPAFDAKTHEEQKKEVDNVRMKEYGRTSLEPGKIKRKSAKTQ